MEKEDSKLLKKFIETTLQEVKIGPSKNYLKKELVRQKLQDLIISEVQNGSIKTQEDLEEWWDTADMSLKALKMIPIQVWKKS